MEEIRKTENRKEEIAEQKKNEKRPRQPLRPRTEASPRPI
jgi:hypothetical protein